MSGTEEHLGVLLFQLFEVSDHVVNRPEFSLLHPIHIERLQNWLSGVFAGIVVEQNWVLRHKLHAIDVYSNVLFQSFNSQILNLNLLTQKSFEFIGLRLQRFELLHADFDIIFELGNMSLVHLSIPSKFLIQLSLFERMLLFLLRKLKRVFWLLSFKLQLQAIEFWAKCSAN